MYIHMYEHTSTYTCTNIRVQTDVYHILRTIPPKCTITYS